MSERFMMHGSWGKRTAEEINAEHVDPKELPRELRRARRQLHEMARLVIDATNARSDQEHRELWGQLMELAETHFSHALEDERSRS